MNDTVQYISNMNDTVQYLSNMNDTVQYISNMNDTVQYSSNMNDTVHIYLVYQREHTDWFNVMSSNSLIYTLLPLYFVIFQHSELCESKHRLLTNSRSSALIDTLRFRVPFVCLMFHV